METFGAVCLVLGPLTIGLAGFIHGRNWGKRAARLRSRLKYTERVLEAVDEENAQLRALNFALIDLDIQARLISAAHAPKSKKLNQMVDAINGIGTTHHNGQAQLRI